jgi:hypothetical protein
MSWPIWFAAICLGYMSAGAAELAGATTPVVQVIAGVGAVSGSFLGVWAARRLR